VATTACAGGVRAPVAPDRLGAIRIVGNRAIASDALEPALALHEAIGDGVAADPYLLTLDTERIRAAYVKRGFFAATVTPRVETAAAGQVVVFDVVEGRRAQVRVAITGLPPDVAPATARALVELADGAPFDYERYDAAKAPLTALLEDAGYARAVVTGGVDADPAGTALVHYDVAPGPRCRIGAITITGARRDLVGAVRARLSLATGDRYSAAALTAAQTDLYELGRFSIVHVLADRAGEGPDVAIRVELTEATRHELHAGIGAGIEPQAYEGRVRAGGSLVPAAAPLITLASDAQIAITFARAGGETPVAPRARVLGSLQRLELWWPRVRGEIEGGVDYQTVEAYTWAGAHARVGLSSPLGARWLQARIGWRIEELTFRDFASELSGDAGMAARQDLGLDGSRRVGAYQASLVADLRDDPTEPHSGAYFAVTGAAGTPWAGGDLHYWQVMPELRGYLAIAGFVLAGRARAGEILGATPGDVPVTERYYSGGTSSQRGFSERYLSPRVTAGPPGCADTGPSSTVIGGAGLIETGVELRRQIVSFGGFPFGSNVFLDGADVRCRPEDLDPAKLKWAVGTGLWGKLAGLKIRVEVGYRLNDQELSGGPSAFGGNFAWHIGVGETY
jgi:outer membrane protein assembly factor BamA